MNHLLVRQSIGTALLHCCCLHLGGRSDVLGIRSRKKELLLEKIRTRGEKGTVAVGSQRTIAHRCLVRRCWLVLLAWFVLNRLLVQQSIGSALMHCCCVAGRTELCVRLRGSAGPEEIKCFVMISMQAAHLQGWAPSAPSAAAS